MNEYTNIKKQSQGGEATDKIIPYNPIFKCNKPDDCWRTLPSNKPIRMDVSTCTLDRYRYSKSHRMSDRFTHSWSIRWYIESIYAPSKNCIIFVGITNLITLFKKHLYISGTDNFFIYQTYLRRWYFFYYINFFEKTYSFIKKFICI